MEAFILAGGLGTRLRPYTFCFPKPLMPVAERPILEIIMSQLKQFGFTKVTISTGYLAELIRTYFAEGSKVGIDISYVHEETPLNTAGAMQLFSPENDHFLMMNGDILTDLDFSAMYSYHVERDAIATVAVKKRQHKIDFGVITSNAKGELVNYIEKPSHDYNVSTGIYVFSKHVISYIKKNESIGLPDLLLRLLAEGEKINCYDVDPVWLDIGRIDDYQLAQEMLIKNNMCFTQNV